MFNRIILSSAILCIAQAANVVSYGVQDDAASGEYNPPAAAPGNTYGAPPAIYDSGYNQPEPEPEHEGCRELKRLHISHKPTSQASFQTFERRGKHYVKISCPNNNRPYAILAGNERLSATIDGATFDNAGLLSTGFNVDFVAECKRGKRISGKPIKGPKFNFKRVACVQLSSPTIARVL